MSDGDIRTIKNIAEQLRSKLALAFINKNEGKYALQMLESILSVVGFVSCVDTESDDSSVQIISDYLNRQNIDSFIEICKFTQFDEMRNIAIRNIPSKFEWIIMLDADEVILEKDFSCLLDMLEQNQFDAWAIPRFNWIDKIWGNFSIHYPDYQTRLFRNDPEIPILYSGAVHETLSGYRCLGFVDTNKSLFGNHSGEFHIHHLKLFQKSEIEIMKRQEFYRIIADETESKVLSIDLNDEIKHNDEKLYNINNIKNIHGLSLESYGFSKSRFFWCEWNHPLERSRPFKEIVDNLIAMQWTKFILPGATCIDIGAHSGDTSIPMGLFSTSKNGDTRGKVFAIEPNPDVFKVLEINAALNSHICDIIPLRIAISDSDREIVINDHGNANCNGGIISDTFSNELQEKLKSITGYSFKAEGYTLDSFVTKFLTKDEIESLSFIKIDCQGYDKEILRASHDFLVKKRPIIQIEWFDWFSLEESADMFSVISSINYTAINPFTGAAVEYNEKLPDLILLPN